MPHILEQGRKVKIENPLLNFGVQIAHRFCYLICKLLIILDRFSTKCRRYLSAVRCSERLSIAGHPWPCIRFVEMLISLGSSRICWAFLGDIYCNFSKWAGRFLFCAFRPTVKCGKSFFFFLPFIIIGTIHGREQWCDSGS